MKLRLSLTLEVRRERPDVEQDERDVDMPGTLVESSPQPIGFRAPEDEEGRR